MTRRVLSYAAEAGHGRVVALLEGGYDPAALGKSVVAVLETLEGVAPDSYDGAAPKGQSEAT
jgi:acetoin utilization deacetylase AcuC-like enzyme